MEKPLQAVFVFFILLVSGCSEVNEVDYRDQYTGQYAVSISRKYTYGNFIGSTVTPNSAVLRVSKAPEAGMLLFAVDSTVRKARLDGDAFVFDSVTDWPDQSIVTLGSGRFSKSAVWYQTKSTNAAQAVVATITVEGSK
jgi:hypothetical protein